MYLRALHFRSLVIYLLVDVELGPLFGNELILMNRNVLNTVRNRSAHDQHFHQLKRSLLMDLPVTF